MRKGLSRLSGWLHGETDDRIVHRLIEPSLACLARGGMNQASKAMNPEALHPSSYRGAIHANCPRYLAQATTFMA
jgi:hypothetical protein